MGQISKEYEFNTKIYMDNRTTLTLSQNMIGDGIE